MTPEILARITTARAAHDLSDLARQAVAATAETTDPAERIIQARRLRQLANEVVDRVVLAEALGGASWQEITDALNRQDADTVRREYEDAVAQWNAMSEEEKAAAAEGFEDVDRWYARHREDYDPPLSTPVADLLNRY
ncbi:hypothetical protein ACIBAC_00415 [Streptomyces sp. NPDC051362]|uniref:hypothetical protein n=1 Tax=Streptomyces sp. NPDC051362 TaxID=3365651 RepID=UPI0037AE30C5